MKDASTASNVVCARVTAAPALGGTKMYQVKISCKGKSKSMYKTKDDFKNVINMFKLVAAMAARKAVDERCEVCTSCSGTSMVRACDEVSLNDFICSLLDKLRKTPREAIEQCSTHKGAIHILMEFMGLSSGKYFCDDEDCRKAERDPAVCDSDEEVESHELENPIAHCSLHRSLSEQFAAFDSVC
ncbi:hypothetical protein PINS_up019698 [Pythium insidiosum]|nr:hypothetical protein PINS_up019698 [Pythium insidiosum]